jgi:hypothetical protein
MSQVAMATLARSRPCSSIQPDTNETDNALFRACTTVTLGNGHKLRFWTDRWLGGCSPKELAPTLYRLAPRKNYMVAYGLEGGAWKRGLQRMWGLLQISLIKSMFWFA